MSAVVFRGGRVISPGSGLDGVMDLEVRDGLIAAFGDKVSDRGAEVVGVAGLVVSPGLVDMHVHLREPGEESKETVGTGTRAAAKGGVTSVACMPNTAPPLDTPATVLYLLGRVAKEGVVRVFPVGCVSQERKGEVLADLSALREAGVVAVSDDGDCVMNSLLAKRAMIYAKLLNIPIIEHAMDKDLADGGVVHEGRVSLTLGLAGVSPLAEEVVIARDLLLAEETGAHLHIAHLSTMRSVQMVRDAKHRGIRVTCEVTPHHLMLTDEAVKGFDTCAKVNPPLRDERSRRALVEGVLDGTIDAIASDHAPHGATDKDVEFNHAAFGVVGLETLLAVSLKVLGNAPGDLPRILARMTSAPARILGLDSGRLEVGRAADLTVFDEKEEFTFDSRTLVSKSRNTPFNGRTLKGRVVHTMVGGRFAVRDGSLQ